ncbi:MAG: hypothetical protein U1A72_16220 [Sulfuritalea sp.]|nr:hypothetical protein [Sulfuritalea sp.]
MTTCKQCGLPVSWVKEQGKWKCRNPNGSDHWDLCSQTRTKRALREGIPFKEKHGHGVRHEGRKKYMHRSAPQIVGKKYTPSCDACAIPPWETCACSERLAT